MRLEESTVNLRIFQGEEDKVSMTTLKTSNLIQGRRLNFSYAVHFYSFFLIPSGEPNIARSLYLRSSYYRSEETRNTFPGSSCLWFWQSRIIVWVSAFLSNSNVISDLILNPANPHFFFSDIYLCICKRCTYIRK